MKGSSLALVTTGSGGEHVQPETCQIPRYPGLAASILTVSSRVDFDGGEIV